MKNPARVTFGICIAFALLVSRQPLVLAQSLTSVAVYLPVISSVARPTPTRTPTPSPTATPTGTQTCRRVAFGVVGMTILTGFPFFNTTVNEGLGTSGILTTLAAARASHVTVMVSLAGPRSGFINSDGSFSLTLWEQSMNRFRGIDVSSYVADGTLLGDGIIDEPQDPTNWGGHTVSAADIDGAAQYLHGIFPTMPAFVGSWPTWLQSTGQHWQNLNGVFVPYVARRGDVVAWTNSQIAAAQAQGLAVFMNMNATAGGATGGEMTPTELLAFGTVLINAPQSRGTLMQAWAVDPAYWSRTDITPVLTQLSALAAQRQACQ